MAIWNREHWIDGRWAVGYGQWAVRCLPQGQYVWQLAMTASHDNRNNNKRAKKQKKKKNVQHQRQVKGLTNGSRNFGATVKINAKQFMKYLWSVTWLTINIYIWAKIPTHPPHSQVLQIWSKQTPTGADKWRKPRTNPDIFVSLNKNANKTCGRHNLAHWLMAMFRLPFCHCVICQMRRESRGSRVRKPWMRGTEDIPTKTGTAVCPTDQVFVAVLLFAAQLNGKRLTLSGSISLPLYSQQSYQSHLASQSVRGSHSKSGTSELRSCHSLKLYSHDRGTGHVI